MIKQIDIIVGIVWYIETASGFTYIFYFLSCNKKFNLIDVNIEICNTSLQSIDPKRISLQHSQQMNSALTT
jgi:hypothetical protein